MIKANNILTKFKQRWQIMLYLEVVLYALGFSIFTYLISSNLLISVLVFLAISVIATILVKPWQPNLNKTSSYLDSQIKTLEHSTSLLLQPSTQLSSLGMLQQQKVETLLNNEIKTINPPHNVLKSGIIATTLILIGFLGKQLSVIDYFQFNKTPIQNEELINFKPTDSVNVNATIPKLVEQSLTINYPSYTRIRALKTQKMDIKAVEGSRISWELQFSPSVKSVSMESMGNSYPMELKDGKYKRSSKLNNSGFYNFKFTDQNDNIYFSDLYAIEVTKDEAPKIDIKGIEQFTQFEYTDHKNFNFSSSISDDYGIDNAFIIATVSKGTGESVKFREEQLSFNTSINRGTKTQTLSKGINLDDMKMEPGDELYFYVHASDLKTPKPNISRSETYFVVIKDTTTNTFGVEGTLGVDRMPDYFRSQRQLIIDTEKLIKNRKNLTKEEFNFKSNELGFDQKALRLKYGEFMGEEEATGGVVSNDNLESFEAEHEEEDHDDHDDPLAEYTHDHDGDNEHNLVDEKKSTETKNPLEEFSHNHDNAEMATLFEESLRSKLLKALGEMWDAELYLRLYEPKKSLPYQYRALKLLQDIKNSARIYVHRIGFDPPPIKEDKRLSGKLEDISSYRKSEELEQEETFVSIKKTISRIEQIINNDNAITEADQQLFESSGNELAQKAIEFPSRFLSTLQELKQLSENKNTSTEILRSVQKGLLLALPTTESIPSKSNLFINKINQLLLKELELND